jgi:outer membrane lipoprotein SlyB
VIGRKLSREDARPPEADPRRCGPGRASGQARAVLETQGPILSPSRSEEVVMPLSPFARARRVLRPLHLVAVLAVAGLAACQPTTGAGPGTQVLQVLDTQTGTIVDVQQVAMPASGLSRAGGAFSGAVIGGLIGNQFGEGGGNDAMTVLGALGGAAAGEALARQTNAPVIPQWTVRLDNGATAAVQSNVPGLQVGARVRVQRLSNGELRIGPL